jgi:hypothetical protein
MLYTDAHAKLQLRCIIGKGARVPFFDVGLEMLGKTADSLSVMIQKKRKNEYTSLIPKYMFELFW